MTNNYNTLPPQNIVEKTMEALTEHGFLPEFVPTGKEALKRINQIIPAGASVMNGGSRTLQEIGFTQQLKEKNHPWNNLHDTILAEKDPQKQAALRKQAALSDYYLGSVHAVTQSGELFIASASGSQIPHLTYTSPNVVLVVGTQKITANMDKATSRIKEYVFPLEDDRMKEVGMGGSILSKLLILNNEPPMMNRKVHIIFVHQDIGF